MTPSRVAVLLVVPVLLAIGLETADAQQGNKSNPKQSLAAEKGLDQANTTPWNKAWTNLVNDVEQSFIPSLPKLTAVEVDLILANPGEPDDDLTMTLLDPDADPVVTVTRIVKVDECGHTRFELPESIAVSPGKVYSIRVSGGTLFGWKYVVGGYKNGEASFNGKPLLPGARSTFLFRTYGTN